MGSAGCIGNTTETVVCTNKPCIGKYLALGEVIIPDKSASSVGRAFVCLFVRVFVCLFVCLFD